MITGLNHITLAVTDLSRSLDFYCDLLGCDKVHEWERGAYLQAGDLWLCLSVCDAVESRHDYTHIAFSTTLEGYSSFVAQVQKKGVSTWKENESEGESIYILDPDGHQLEIHIGNLESRMRCINKKNQDCGADG